MPLASRFARPAAPAVALLLSLSLARRRRASALCFAIAGLFLAVPAIAAALPQAAAPVFSVAPGSYPSAQSVTITDSTLGATIYYSTNGAYSGVYSTPYSAPVTISSSEVLVAVAVAPGYTNSPETVGTYLITSSKTPFIYTVAGNQIAGFSGDSGPATFAQLNAPQASVVDSAGNIYIADTGNQIIRKINASTGIITSIAGTGVAAHTGDGGPAVNAALWLPEYLAIDHAGNLYIGEIGDNEVRVISASTGVISTFAGNPTGTGSLNGPAIDYLLNIYGLACDSAGNLFIADSREVYEVNATTGIITGISPLAGIPPGIPTGIVVDSAENIYVSDGQNNEIDKITLAGTATIIAGSPSATPGGDGGPALNAGLNYPTGLAVDSVGNVYVADNGDQVIRQINVQTGIINTFAGVFQNQSSLGGDGDPATSVGFFSPSYLTSDSAGNIYLTDSQLSCIRKITPATAPPTVAAASPAFSVAPGNYVSAQTVSVSSTTPGAAIYLTWDGSTPVTSGTGYHGPISLTGAANLKAVAVAPGFLKSPVTTASYTITTPPLSVISTVAGNGVDGFSGSGGPATSAELNSPYAVTVDAAGNLYIADYGDSVVWMVSGSSGNITVVAGTGTVGNGPSGGLATQTALHSPTGVAVDKSGDLYFSDFYNNRIRMLNPQTGILTTIAGPGSSSSLGDGGPATAAYLALPQGLAFDKAGNLYIADSINQRVRMINLTTGIISTVAGGSTTGQPGDGGLATAASILPTAVAFDAAGNLYIADQGRIRKVSSAAGIITTIAGNGNIGQSGDGELAVDADVDPESGIAVDSSGNVYFPSYPNEIRKIDAKTGIISAVAGNGYTSFTGDGGSASVASISTPYGAAFDSAGSLYFGDLSNSRVRKVTFPAPAPSPYFNLAGGTYNTPQSLALTDAAPGATIYYTYTANGTTPTTASPVYTGPITINTTGVVEAIATAPGFTESLISSKSYVYTPLPPAAAPYFNLAGGTYHSPQMLTLTDTTPGSAIHYTTNGTTPTAGSTLYTGPITVASTESIEAVAIATGYSVSPASSKAYTYVPYSPAAAPSFSLAGGTYNTPQMLTLTDATPGATIYYTTNGSAPTTSSTKYTGPITIAATELVEAVAIATGYSLSPVSSKAYTYNPLPLAAPPYFSLAGGHYTTPQMLTLTDSTPGAVIYYATNGSTPTTGSTRYTGPITISASETVIAIAAAPGYINSNASSKAYTIP